MVHQPTFQGLQKAVQKQEHTQFVNIQPYRLPIIDLHGRWSFRPVEPSTDKRTGQQQRTKANSDPDGK
jgi:hypothetical protein